MQATQDCTSRTSSRSSAKAAKAPSTVFTPAFLARIRAFANPPSSRQAALAGPWDVEEMDNQQFAVTRREEPYSQGGRVFGVFLSRVDALQTAAVLPAVGAPSHLQLNPNGHRLGYALHDGQGFLGHLARDEERLLPHLHLARNLAADPDSLALLMEAAGPGALTMLGRALHRRIEPAP